MLTWLGLWLRVANKMNDYTCIFYLLVIYSDFGGTLSIIGLKTGQQIFRKLIGYYEEMNCNILCFVLISFRLNCSRNLVKHTDNIWGAFRACNINYQSALLDWDFSRHHIILPSLSYSFLCANKTEILLFGTMNLTLPFQVRI